MKIGLTYDLRSVYLAEGYSLEETAEFDREDTIVALESALNQLGYETDRIGHARELASRLVAGDRWDLVFNICEGLHGLGRESQVPAILDLYQIPYTFAGPLMMSVCLHKGITKTLVRDGGVPTAKFFVADSLERLQAWRPAFGFPMFVKPVAEGTGKGVSGKSRVTSRRQLLQIGEELLAQFHQPILIEQYLSGREFTVGIIGTGTAARVVGTLEIVLRAQAESGAYSYNNKANYEDLVEYHPVYPSDDSEVREAERVALTAWQLLDGVDAGRIDIRSDSQNRPHFIEVNPLAGLHPVHSDLPMLCTAFGVDYVELIRRIVESAIERSHLDFPTARTSPILTTCSNGAEKSQRVTILHQHMHEDSQASDTDVLDQVNVVRQALEQNGHEVAVLGCSMEVENLPSRLAGEQTELVFNLVESLGGTDRLMALVPSILEKIEMPYTGASTTALMATTNKLAAKQVLHDAGLPTPAWFCPTGRREGIQGVSSVPSKSPRLYTAIIKAIWEHASFAIDDSSVVTTDGSRTMLKSLIRNRQATIGCPCFAEEYIDGREFNVSIISRDGEPIVLPPAEIEFQSFPDDLRRIVGYKAKWQTDSFEYQHTVRRFDLPKHDRPLLKELSQLSLRCWNLFGLTGYARVDFRVDRRGRPLILEVNANPCLSPDAGFAAALDRAGISFAHAIRWLIADAKHRSATVAALPVTVGS